MSSVSSVVVFMNCVILSVGDELITGKTVDTNSAWLAGCMVELGVEPLAHQTVGDDVDAVADAIVRSAGRAEAVLVSGGLGPTADDLTRQGRVKAMGGAELVLDEPSLEAIAEFFRRRGREMAAANRIQAMFPAGSTVLANAVGTAPGMAARVGASDVFVMPGVPHEMKWMFEHEVRPRLKLPRRTIRTHIVHTFGRGESDVGQMIADLMTRGQSTTVGTTVCSGMVSVRLIIRSDSAERAQAEQERLVAELRRRLGDLVVGEGEDTMASVVGRLLRQKGQTLATAESCTGGLLGSLLTAVPGSSEYYLGGAVSYANAAKQALLGVPAELLERHGAVSDPVAAAMAERCRRRLAADWALAVTGIAGPGGGSEDKPVGLVYTALAGPPGTTVTRHLFPGNREHIRERSAMAALNELRLAMRGWPGQSRLWWPSGRRA